MVRRRRHSLSATTTLGTRIVTLRERQGMTARELAQRAEISTSFVSELENDLSEPRIGIALRLARALNVSIRLLVEGETTEEATDRG